MKNKELSQDGWAVVAPFILPIFVGMAIMHTVMQMSMMRPRMVAAARLSWIAQFYSGLLVTGGLQHDFGWKIRRDRMIRPFGCPGGRAAAYGAPAGRPPGVRRHRAPGFGTRRKLAAAIR